MKSITELLNQNKSIRVLGFDDAPFGHERHGVVNVAGVVCANTRFEGMLWGEVRKDGTDATQVLADMLIKSKFAQQVQVVLIDGLAVGGFNLINLPELARTVERPCIAVMRKMPDLEAIDNALKNFDDYDQRKALLSKAGEIYAVESGYFQVQGCSVDEARHVLAHLTDTGNVPEALRLAHLIGAAVMTGQSGRRA